MHRRDFVEGASFAYRYAATWAQHAINCFGTAGLLFAFGPSRSYQRGKASAQAENRLVKYQRCCRQRLGKLATAASDRCATVAQLDAYGAVRQGWGKSQDCPFRYQGQYEDVETGLYYNRFRYYDPEAGTYISQDPIRIIGGIKLYGYVADTCSWIDELGLNCAQVKNGVLEIKQKFPAGSPEAQELESFAQSWNQEMSNAGGSYTRQAVPKATRRAATKAAKADKAANPALYRNGEVPGHTPDVGWGGQTTGPFVPLSPAVNSYVGGATQAVPVGTTYTSVVIVP